jgi:hypothetical protein
MNLHAARLLFFAVFCLAGAGGSAVYFYLPLLLQNGGSICSCLKMFELLHLF